MPKINPQKLKEYLSLKSDPALALMKTISILKTDLKEIMQEMIEKELERRVKEITQIKGDKGDKPSKEELLGLIKEVKALFKGDKGDRPTREEVLSLIDDAIRNGLRGKNGYAPIKGIDFFDGEPGYTPIKGVDYFTPDDIKRFMKMVFSNIIPPKKGVDYFTKQDIQEFSVAIMEDLSIKEILEEIKKLWEAINNLKRGEQLGGQRTIHRGGIDFAYSETLGTGDGTTTQFTLADTPYDDNSLPFLFVGGGVQFKTDDWTRSGKTITFLTAPEDGATIRAPFYRKL